MKRIVIFSATTGYQLRAFDAAAGRLGIDLRLATDRCSVLDDPWRDHAVPVRFHDPEASLFGLVENLGAAPVHGVIAVGDRPTVLAARLAERYGIPWHPPAAADACRHKATTRARLAAAGLPAPWFEVVQVDRPERLPADVRFPCVVKPVALSGSRGVMRADSPAELAACLSRLRRILETADVRAMRDGEAGTAIIEGFIPGREFAVEGVIDHGRVHRLAVFDKPDPLDGPFFEETIYVTPSSASSETLTAIDATVAQACRALGLWHGPFHAECRVSGLQVFVLEVAARPIGGLCARALRFSQVGAGDVGLEELLLRHAAGLPWRDRALVSGASGVMMIPIPAAGVFRGLDGEAEALAVPGVTDLQVTAKLEQMLLPLPEGATYLGFLFAEGSSPREVERTLRLAHARLRVRLDQPIPMV